MHQRSMHVWKMKLQKLLFSFGPHMCVKQHFHAWCTSSQSIETDSLTLICKTTWLLQLPHMSHASESILCEPSTHFFARLTLMQTGFIISLRFFQIILVLLYFIFASGLKFQLLSEIHSHLCILQPRYAWKEKISTWNSRL